MRESKRRLTAIKRTPLLILLSIFLFVLLINFGSSVTECTNAIVSNCIFNQTGKTYTLGGSTYSINSSLNITADNIIINGNGSVIYYNNRNLSRIYGFYGNNIKRR